MLGQPIGVTLYSGAVHLGAQDEGQSKHSWQCKAAPEPVQCEPAQKAPTVVAPPPEPPHCHTDTKFTDVAQRAKLEDEHQPERRTVVALPLQPADCQQETKFPEFCQHVMSMLQCSLRAVVNHCCQSVGAVVKLVRNMLPFQIARISEPMPRLSPATEMSNDDIGNFSAKPFLCEGHSRPPNWHKVEHL